LGQLALQEVEEVAVLAGLEGDRREVERAPARLEGRVGIDASLLLHLADHEVAALARALGVAVGAQRVRALDDGSEHRRLVDREIGHALAEEEARGLADAMDRRRAPPSHVDLVEIGLEDLALRITGL